MLRVALCLGRVQGWYAAGYREGTPVERIAIFPCWLVFRLLFVVAFTLAQKDGLIRATTPNGNPRSGASHTRGVPEDDRPPICPTCGVTMVPAVLSADEDAEGEWVCLECEELDEAT